MQIPKIFQLQDTATAISTVLAKIPHLPIARNEHIQNFIRDTEDEMGYIALEIKYLTRGSGMGDRSPLIMPWIRRDIDKVQKRLDILQVRIHKEITAAYPEDGQ
jgi:hypothetical protein